MIFILWIPLGQVDAYQKNCKKGHNNAAAVYCEAHL